MKELTQAQRRKVENKITMASRILKNVRAETGLAVDVGAYTDNNESLCIFIHDNDRKKVFFIDRPCKIPGFFDSEEFKNGGMDVE